jgi:hypothetical protein
METTEVRIVPLQLREPAPTLADQKEKWFQVTLFAVRSPAGMLGTSVASELP